MMNGRAFLAPAGVTAVTPPPVSSGGGGGSGGRGAARAFARELDKVDRPTKAQKKARRRVLEAAVLELLPDEPIAIQAAPIIAQMVARQPETVQGWAPVLGPRPVVMPPHVVQALHEQVARWLAHEAIQRALEDDFETELLLME
jgi:hypothetical protein